MSNVGYIRVSTVDQNTERQLDGVPLDKVFEDKCSGKDTDRPGLTQMLDYVREGDTVHVHDISRMARNLANLLELVKQLTSQGITIRFHKERLEFAGESNPMQELMLSMLGAVYQFERSMLLERQREGIKQGQAAGRYKGRRPNIDADEVLNRLAAGERPTQIARDMQISRDSVYRIAKQGA
ncbi:MAG: recombinase family protein [Marinobacterium sp.]|nr:recombinase family protein [Marinobacterium sp.]